MRGLKQNQMNNPNSIYGNDQRNKIKIFGDSESEKWTIIVFLKNNFSVLKGMVITFNVVEHTYSYF